MKQINDWNLRKLKYFLEQAIKINSETDHCIDISLLGNWNDVEVHVYESKDVPSTTIINETFSLHGTGWNDDEAIDSIETELDKLLLTQKQ